MLLSQILFVAAISIIGGARAAAIPAAFVTWFRHREAKHAPLPLPAPRAVPTTEHHVHRA
jgi:hypothetical protein